MLHKVTVVIFFFFLVFTCFETNLLEDGLALTTGGISFVAIILSGIKLKTAQKTAFLLSSIAVIFITLTVFMHNYPIVLVSSLNSHWSVTVFNSSSSQYSLQVMKVVALILIPIILVYQLFSHLVFRKRLTEKDLG